MRPDGELATLFRGSARAEEAAFERGELRVTNKLPVRELRGNTIELSHSLEEQRGLRPVANANGPCCPSTALRNQ